MSKELSSSEFTFLSFYHSQGVYPAQIYLFGYFEKMYYLQAELDPSPAEQERYIAYLSGKGKNRHIQVDTNAGSLNLDLTNTFVELRRRVAQDDPSLQGLGTSGILKCLGYHLTSTEMTRLDPTKEWLGSPSGLSAGRDTRLLQRVQAGKASFLLHYGRDKAPTGYVEFDEMYQSTWGLMDDERNKYPGQPSILEELETMVYKAEMHHLGHTILAYDPVQVS